MTTSVNGDFNLISWSVNVDAVPSRPNGAAGVGSFTFSKDREKDDQFKFNEIVELSSSLVPGDVFRGPITDLSMGDIVEAGGVSAVNVFNVDRTVPPFRGTLDQALRFWSNLVGWFIEFSIVPSTPVKAWPGWNGNMWDMLKNVMFLEDIDLIFYPWIPGSFGFVNGIPKSTRSLDLTNIEKVPVESVARDNPARFVDVTYYNNTWVINGEVYPPGENSDATIYSVEAGETIEVEVETGAWLEKVNQPNCVAWVEADPGFYNGTNGVYSVVGGDNLPVPPARWLNDGGSLEVSLTDDPSIVKVTIRGMDDERLSPYRIAMSSGNHYNSLRITGTGTRFNEKTLRFPTGADPILTSEEVGETLNMPLVSTLDDAMKAASALASDNMGVAQSLSDLSDDEGYGAGFVLNTGTVFEHNDVKWRTLSASLGPEGVSWGDSENATSLGDLNDRWGDAATLGDLQAVWEGRSLGDWALRPLRNSDG